MRLFLTAVMFAFALLIPQSEARPNRQLERQNVALRHISGFEIGSLEWGATHAGGTLDTTIVRSGNQSYRAAADNARVDNSQYQFLGGLTEAYFRFYVYVGTMPSTSVTVMQLMDSGSGNPSCSVDISNSGEVFFNAQFGTAIEIGVIEAGAWHMIEGHVICDPTTGTIEARLDGGNIFSDTNRNTGAGLGNFSLGVNGSVSGGVFYFDDWHLNDTTGSLNNSWPGQGSCYSLRPNSDAGVNNWTTSTGTDHYAMVDDNLSADYLVTTSNTLNLEDRWGLEDLSVRVSQSSLVRGMMAGAFGEGFGSGPSRTTLLRFRDAAGNTQDGVTHTWTVGFSDWRYPHTTAEQTWDGSAVPLTVDYIDGMFMSAIDSNTNTREIRWYGAWLTVEVVEPVPGLSGMAGGLCPILNE